MFVVIIMASHMVNGEWQAWSMDQVEGWRSPLLEPVVRILNMHFCLRGVDGMVNRVGVVMKPRKPKRHDHPTTSAHADKHS
jgi:hypothetical protein